jgi:hypothetical protein
MELKDLVALLPVAFAADIAESAAKFSPPYDRIILFVDNYETIQEQLGEMFGKETHNFVQSLARELVDLNSKALLVIAGRDRLRWGEVRRRDGNWVLDPTSLWAQDASRRDAQIYISRFLEQYCIGDLSETDAREYLIEQHELTDPTFVSAIFEFTGGYPLALGVATDLIDEADAQMSVDFMALRARVLEYKPFSNEWREEVNDWLLERLLEQLKINHRKELLKLTKAAAIPRWFTLELLFHLTEDSGLADQFRRLVGYSFVEPYEVEDLHAYRLHSVVRKIIRQTIEIPKWSDHMEKAAIEYFETQAGKFSGKSNWRYLFEMVYLLPVSHYQYWFRQNRTKCPEVVKTHA